MAAGAVIPGYKRSTSSTTPVNGAFANKLAGNIQGLLSPGAQDALINQQYQTAVEAAKNEIGASNQHLAEQWAARTGRSLNGGGGVAMQSELAHQRLDPVLAQLEQNRIGQMMSQRNMLAGFAPALLAMQQHQSDMAAQQKAQQQAEWNAKNSWMFKPANTAPTPSPFGVGSGTAPGGNSGGFASNAGGSAGWGDGFGQLGSERGIWAAPKNDYQVFTSGTPSAIKSTDSSAEHSAGWNAGQMAGNAFASAMQKRLA